MFEEVARSSAKEKAPAERNDKGQLASDVFASTSARRTAAEPPGISRGFQNRHLFPALVSGSTLQRPRRTRIPFGIIFYLASITVVATATIGVFFGVGFFLLIGSAEGVVPSAAGTHASGLSTPFFLVMSRFLSRPVSPDVNLTSAPVEVGIPGPAAIAALPPAPLPPPSLPDQQGTSDKSDGPPPPILGRLAGASQDSRSAGNEPGSEASETAAAPSALPTDPAEPALAPPAAEAMPASRGLVLSAGEIGELLARGDIFLRMGDVTSARLFYERAANAGNGQGAMRMGATFDPTFLGRAGLGGARGDPAEAQSWYRRAIDLSRAEIKQGRNALETR